MAEGPSFPLVINTMTEPAALVGDLDAFTSTSLHQAAETIGDRLTTRNVIVDVRWWG